MNRAITITAAIVLATTTAAPAHAGPSRLVDPPTIQLKDSGCRDIDGIRTPVAAYEVTHAPGVELDAPTYGTFTTPTLTVTATGQRGHRFHRGRDGRTVELTVVNTTWADACTWPTT